ncbi:chemotaxis protein CheW [Pseudoduganella sp. RAF53_2]|uniref:chemotaxis protein CheW n=1 Tax=unclassified Pseudoduganella TaxID=2637179 RepID=UPI003F9C3524
MSEIEDLNDCWKRIGVAGDHSCELLASAVHCRNCEVYADAAQRNLRRPVSEEYKREWAEHFRAPETDATERDASLVVFRIGREWLSLPTSIFVQIAPAATPHRLPHRRARGLRGVVNVGGRLYPCMDLAELFGIDDREGESTTGRYTFARLMLVQWGEQAYAIPVTEMYGIARYAAGEIKPPAATINKGLTRYLSGVLPMKDMQIGCLDADLIGHQLARALS